MYIPFITELKIYLLTQLIINSSKPRRILDNLEFCYMARILEKEKYGNFE